MEEEKFFASPEKENEEEQTEGGAVVEPDRGQVITEKEADERKEKREENPNWWREQP